MVLKPILAVSCALLTLFSLFFSTPVVSATDNSFPSTFYVTFKGDLQLDHSLDSNDATQKAHIVQFLNGTIYLAKTVLFTFSMEESPNGEYTVKFTLIFDDFYNEVTLPATVSNGRVYIDSTPTMLVVNPKDLINDNTIQIFQTENWSFSGTVMPDARTATLIEDYFVSSKRVEGVYQQPDGSKSMWTPLLFYDTTTGILVSPPEYIMDEVLFNKVDVALLYNGVFLLSDYSENLNFTLWDFTDPLNPSIVSKPSNPSPNPSSNGGQLRTTPPSSPSNPSLPWLILIPVFVAVFISVAFLTYKSSSKKKKSGRPKTNSDFLKIHIAHVSKKEGAHYEFY